MPSLSSYDRGKKAFQGRTYRADIDVSLDFLDRVFSIIRKAKKKQPHWVILEGNHENRIKKAINIQPELEGTIDFSDLEWDRYFDEIIPYEGLTPGVHVIDGIHYAHYFVSGGMGRPLGGEHPAATLLAKQHVSCSAGHSHLGDFSMRSLPSGDKIYGCVGGCFQDFDADWAGSANRLWYRGLVVCRGVSRGSYDPEFVSLERLRRMYGQNSKPKSKSRREEPSFPRLSTETYEDKAAA